MSNDSNIAQSTMLPPLPERMRPHDLDGYVGQRHLVGDGCILRNMITSGNLSSFILWGPPGVGKTTLAGIIASSLKRDFYTLSAVSAGVKDVRDVIDRAKGRSVFSQGAAPILFIDEIHRFSKSQQDALLGAVENGTIVLIGATTENPSFEVITPLLSRCQVFVLKSLEVSDLEVLLSRAIHEDELLKTKNIDLKETEALFRYSSGDGRKLLNVLEIVVDAQSGKDTIVIDNETVTACIQQNMAIYDKGGEMHILPAGKIYINPWGCSSTEYVVGCGYDMASGARFAEQSVLGCGDKLYMNAGGIYVLGSNWYDNVTRTYKESVYTVEEHESGAETQIIRFSLDDLKVIASGKVPGSMESQFSADEYQGYLRLVTTRDDSSYKVYKDETAQGTTTHMLMLNDEERVREIAQMLSGSDVSEAAIQNAKELLKL